jgi:hypothetical protein
MKIAKLQIKMIVALFVVGYDYDVVDSKGRLSERLQVQDYNDPWRVGVFLLCLIFGNEELILCVFSLFFSYFRGTMSRRGGMASHVFLGSSVSLSRIGWTGI